MRSLRGRIGIKREKGTGISTLKGQVEENPK